MATRRREPNLMIPHDISSDSGEPAGLDGPGIPQVAVADVADLIKQAVSEAMKPLEHRLQAIEDRTPRIVTGRTQGERDRAALGVQGFSEYENESAEVESWGGKTLASTADGIRVPEYLLRSNPPKFEAGQRVRLNPDSVREGSFMVKEVVYTDPRTGRPHKEMVPDESDEPRTWREVIVAYNRGVRRKKQRLDPENLVGYVRKLMRWTETGWKYQVVIPGLTESPLGDGCREHELLAA